MAEQLAVIQRQCTYMKSKVIIVDGFESAGKGVVINELVRELDTKHFILFYVFESLVRGFSTVFIHGVYGQESLREDFAIRPKPLSS